MDEVRRTSGWNVVMGVAITALALSLAAITPSFLGHWLAIGLACFGAFVTGLAYDLWTDL